MKKSAVLFCLTVLPFLLQAQFSITGTVSDSVTGEQLPGAHIIIRNTYYFTVSNPDGTFKFQNLKPGNYTLKVSFMGYREYIKNIDLKGDVKIDVLMQPAAILEDEVVISATRASAKSPETFQNISRKSLKAENLGEDIPFLLKSTPAVVSTSDAGAGVGYTNIRIRGTDITRINVTLNGVPVNDPESQGVFWVDMPDLVSSVDNIQVQRGVGTSTNGAAAFGASINIQTQKLREDPYAGLSSSAGSYNTFKNTLRFGTGLIAGKWAFDGRLSKISSDGYIDRAFSNLRSFYVSGGYYGKNDIFKVIVFSGEEKTYQAWYGVPGDSLATNRTYNPAGEYVDADGKMAYYDNQTDNYRQDHYQLHYSHAFNPGLNINTSLFYIRGGGYYENYKPDQKFSKYGLDDVIIGGDTITTTDMINRKHLSNDFYGLTMSVNYNNLKKLQMTFGAGYNYYDGDHYGNIIWAQYAGNSTIDSNWYYNTGIKKQYNLYAKANYQINDPLNVYADLQVRGITYDISGTLDDLQDITQAHFFNFFNPKLGVVYDFSVRHQAYFSFAVANREPTRSDYRDADKDHVPQPERLYDYELGYVFKSDRVRINANLFYMNYKDQLVLTGEINNVGAPIFTNVPKSYRTGLDFMGGWKISKKFRWEVNGSFSSNKILDFTQYVDDWSPPYGQITRELGKTDLSFSPSVVANSTLSYQPVKRLFIKLISKYVGKQYIDNTSSPDWALDPWFVNDVMVNYSLRTKFIKEIGFSLMVNNIFSFKYESNAWVYHYYYDGKEYALNGYFPQAPINFLGGISLKF